MNEAPAEAGLRFTRKSLQSELVALIAVIVLVVGAVIGSVALITLNRDLLARVDEQLQVALGMALRPAGPGGSLGGPIGDQQPVPNQFESSGDQPKAGPRLGTLEVILVEGQPIGGQAVTEVGEVVSLSPDQLASITEAVASHLNRVDLPELGSYRIAWAKTPASGQVVVGQDLSDVHRTTRNLTVVLALTTLAAVVLAAVAAQYLVRAALRPLESLRKATLKVRGQQLESGSVALTDQLSSTALVPGTEVGDLGLSFDEMLKHVEEAINRREASETRLKQFAADASHELRTPLAAISGHAELAARKQEEMPESAALSLERIRSEAGRMATLVEDLLLLARIDSGDDGGLENVDMARLVTDCVTDAQVMAPDHRWVLEVPEDTTELTVRANQTRLHQAVANLLSNARQHTPAGTTVTTRIIQRGEAIAIEVEDDGPGIDPSVQDRVFQRFTRGDSSRQQPGASERFTNRSTGLGLAITAAIVETNGGTVTAHSRPGKTTFLVQLPVFTGRQG